MTALILAVALTATAPLTVRVLEAAKPTTLTLDAKSIQCGDAQVPAHATLEVGVREVRVGALKCPVVIAEGPSTVTIGSVVRRFTGTLRVVIESGLLKIFNEIELEPYLASVVGAVSPGDFKPAALEAQAIVSRTFAATARRRHAAGGYDVCDTSHCQLYRGQESESPAAKAAVDQTAGQVLLVGGIALKSAFFHLACGGHTSRAADVLREDGAGPGVSDLEPSGQPLCKDLPDFAWEWVIDRPAYAAGLGLNSDGAPFEPLRRDAAGRVLELKAFGKRYSGDEFLAKVTLAFGAQSLRSTKVTVKEIEGTLTFTGTGLGHGVGLCQQGAKTLAARGADAKAILKHYFPDSQVRVP